MRKLLLFVLALALVAWMAKSQLDRHTRADGPSESKRQLDQVRAKARAIERDDQRRVDEALKESEAK